MPKHIIRKDLSALGFYFVLYILLLNAVAGVAVGFAAILGPLSAHMGSDFPAPLMKFTRWLSTDSGHILATLILNAASQYLIAMPVIAHIIRRNLPTIAVREYIPAWYERGDVIPRAEEPLKPRDILALIPIIVFLMAAGSIIGSAIAGLLGDAAGISAENSQVEMLLSGSPWMTILFVVILAPLAEELFFRKLLVDQVAPLSRRGAVLVSAVTFGFYHQNFFQIFYALFLGALFAFIYVRTEKIIYTILLHMGVNLFGGVVLPHFTEGLDELDSVSMSPEQAQAVFAGNPGMVAILFAYLLLAVIGCILFFRWLAKGKWKLAERYGTAPLGDFAVAYFGAPGQILFLISCVGLALFSLVSGMM